MSIIRKEIDLDQPLTSRQKQMLQRLSDSPATPGEDFPELTDEELQGFYKLSEMRKEERRKPSVTIRISASALKTAKSLGKGYTSVLARMLEADLADKERIKQFL